MLLYNSICNSGNLGQKKQKRFSPIDVIAPTPNQAASTPTGSYLTLTTCHPRFSAEQRLIVHARLVGGALSKAELPDGPPALFEG